MPGIAASLLLVFTMAIEEYGTPAALAATLMVFAVASRELVASLLLAPSGVQTVSLFIWRQFEQGSVGQGMAMSAVTIFMTTGITLLVTLRLKRR